MKELSGLIRSKVAIKESDLDVILSNFKRKQVKKEQLILKRGQIAYQYYYIKSGALCFFFGEFDELLTAWIVFQNEFLPKYPV